jgi:hypothetical protein
MSRAYKIKKARYETFDLQKNKLLTYLLLDLDKIPLNNPGDLDDCLENYHGLIEIWEEDIEAMRRMMQKENCPEELKEETEILLRRIERDLDPLTLSVTYLCE